MAAPRPWPICKGPVGLALTNSTCTFLPSPDVVRPKDSPSDSISSRVACHAAGATTKLMKPGPAISHFDSRPLPSPMSRIMISATWRGALRSPLAICMAMLQEKSPCSGLAGMPIMTAGKGVLTSSSVLAADCRAVSTRVAILWRIICLGIPCFLRCFWCLRRYP